MAHVVVMGVSGCGKSTVGRLLAQQLGVAFIEGDELHPPRNVALMASGTSLTDEDRVDWLASVGSTLARTQGGAVASCSALRRRYRDQLRHSVPDLVFIHLHGPRELLAQRLAQRKGHYMPASLLDSQLQTLEPPSADESALTFDIDETPQKLAQRAAQILAQPAAS
ncbi:MAG: gluconokinase [Betaproteobacteria bacterium]|jgi:carbohydrate kinase (thermoresistant glucokinase family)